MQGGRFMNPIINDVFWENNYSRVKSSSLISPAKVIQQKLQPRSSPLVKSHNYDCGNTSKQNVSWHGIFLMAN
jgi:hypothetical protein